MRLKFILVASAALFLLCSTAQAQSTPEINARCSAKWAGDFSMQDYCRKKQLDAAGWLGRYLSIHKITSKVIASDAPPVESKILEKCYEKWTDAHGPNFPMVRYCTEKQLAAYHRVK
jgi:hypothetical protein